MRQPLKFEPKAPKEAALEWVGCSEAEIKTMWELTESAVECERRLKMRGKNRSKTSLLCPVWKRATMRARPRVGYGRERSIRQFVRGARACGWLTRGVHLGRSYAITFS